MTWLGILKLLLLMAATWGVNQELKRSGSYYKNTNPELVKRDSVIMVKFDSVLTQTYRK